MSNADSDGTDRYRYQCKECDWRSGKPFEEVNRAFAGLAAHVSNAPGDHIGWTEYLVKHRLHECEGCGTPLDMTTIDRCYECRISHEGLEHYVAANTDQ